MRKFGIIGFPLSHSFSPAYFADKFAKEGIENCSYDAYPIPDITELTTLLKAQPQLKGLNVTIPFKKSVIPFLHEKSLAVSKISACNCIKIRDGNLIGHNTDVIGFKKSLLPLLESKHSKALILGTGGSSAAVEFVLDKLEIDFLYVSRTASGNKRIAYNDVDESIISRHKLIINSTPLGMYPLTDACPDLPYRYLTSEHYLFDLVYNPAETLFLKKGIEMGATTKNGADMLYIQAEESWKIWNED